jgi:glutathione S-transferase
MLTLYGRATSSNVQAVLWALEEMGLDYTRVDRGGKFGGLSDPDYIEMNPHSRIPVLVHDDNPAIFESAAILRYLGAVFGDDTLWPSDPVARAQVDKWAEWGKIEVANGFTGPIFWRVVRTPKARHDLPAIKAAVDDFEAELARADHALGKTDYLAGDQFTLADIPFGHVLFRYFDIEIDRRDMPNLKAYYDRLCARKAYADTVMVSYESLRNTI